MNSEIKSRTEVLLSLIERTKPLGEVSRLLAQFSFDSNPLVTLRAEHIKSVLLDYLAGRVDESYVECWAELIELRDDIEFDLQSEQFIKNCIHDLANPTLSGALTKETANKIILSK